MEILKQLASNYGAYAGIAASAIILFSRIARLTPNKTDNRLVKTVRKLARTLGLDIPDRDK